jgi:hypothetical protein
VAGIYYDAKAVLRLLSKRYAMSINYERRKYMNKTISGIALILLMFLVSGTVFSQSFELAGGFVGGYGKAVSENEGDYTNPGVGTVGLGVQMGVLGKRIALLAEGSLAWVLPDPIAIMWNGGAIFECYPFVFENGETRIGFGVGGGFGRFLENAWYVRAEIPFLFSFFKLGINGEYYFLENGPAFRVGLMLFFRGGEVVEYFKNQDVFKTTVKNDAQG